MGAQAQPAQNEFSISSLAPEKDPTIYLIMSARNREPLISPSPHTCAEPISSDSSTRLASHCQYRCPATSISSLSYCKAFSPTSISLLWTRPPLPPHPQCSMEDTHPVQSQRWMSQHEENVRNTSLPNPQPWFWELGGWRLRLGKAGWSVGSKFWRQTHLASNLRPPTALLCDLEHINIFG